MRYRSGGGLEVGLLGTLAVALLVGLLVGAPAATGAPPPVPPSAPSVVEAVPLIAREVGPHTLFARLEGGYCLGDPYRPALERVRWTADGPIFHNIGMKSAHRPERRRVTLTAFVRRPVLRAAARAGESPPSVVVCSGIAYELRAKVVLPEPIAETEFFDGSFSPPRRMRARGLDLVAPSRFLTR